MRAEGPYVRNAHQSGPELPHVSRATGMARFEPRAYEVFTYVTVASRLKPLYPLDFVNLSATWSLNHYRFTLTLADQGACDW
jgi:hypothetical protein